jgi:quinol monooxygenase YgiN
MAQVTMFASFAIKPGQEDNAVAAFKKVAEASHQEPGCVKYAWMRSTEDPSSFAVFEVWQDAAALESHMKEPHLDELRASFGDLLAGAPTVHRLSQLGLGDAQKGAF